MYGFHSGIRWLLALLRRLEMYCSGDGPSSLCARSTAFRNGGTTALSLLKLVASDCGVQHRVQVSYAARDQQPAAGTQGSSTSATTAEF